jgi:hypothetical protein
MPRGIKYPRELRERAIRMVAGSGARRASRSLSRNPHAVHMLTPFFVSVLFSRTVDLVTGSVTVRGRGGMCAWAMACAGCVMSTALSVAVLR